MKKVLSIFLILCILIPTVSVSSFAAATYTSGYYEYSVSSGNATILSVSDSISGDIVVPSSLGGYTVTAIADASSSASGAFYSCSEITSVTVPTTIKAIGDYAFAWCTGIKSAYIPASVTKIGKGAFTYCRSLESINIPNSVTSLGGAAFYNCNALTSVTVGSGIKTIDTDTFNYCSSLKSINIPEGVTSIGAYSFASCKSLTTVEIPSSVLSIGSNAFKNSNNVTIKCEAGSYAEKYAKEHGIYVFGFSQIHTIENYQSANTGYKTEYFNGAGTPLDGSKGNSDFCIPGLSKEDNFVPQGCAYLASKNQVLITAYDPDKKSASRVFALDADSGNFVAEYALKYDGKDLIGHTGGIATYGGTVYIANDKNIYIYESGYFTDGEANTNKAVSVGTDLLNGASCSYVSVYNGILWTGNFYDPDIKDNSTKGNVLYNSAVLGFDLTKSTALKKADYTILIEDYDKETGRGIENIQSAVYADGRLYLTTSCGRKNDSLFWVAPASLEPGRNLLYSDNFGNVQGLPMMEDGFVKDGYYYFITESAAYYYHGKTSGNVSVKPTDVVWKINLDTLDSKMFYITKDNNSFRHNNTSGAGFEGMTTYEISKPYLNALLKNASNTERAEIIKQTDSKWKGSCFGISSTIALLKNGTLSISDLTNKKVSNYYSIGKPCDDTSNKFRDVINYYQLSTNLSSCSNDATIAFSSSKFNAFLDDILSFPKSQKETLKKIVECSREDKLYVIGFATQKVIGENHGHAMIPVSCAYQDGKYIVRLYDINTVNSGNDGSFVTMFITDDFSGYELSNGEYGSWISSISIFDVDKLAIPATGKKSLAKKASVKKTDSVESYVLFKIIPEKAFTLTNKDGRVLRYDGDQFSGDMKVYDVNLVINDDACEYVFKIDNSENFTLDCNGTVYCSLGNDNRYFSVDGENISHVMFFDDTVKLFGENITFQAYATTDEEIAENNPWLVYVSANSTGGVTLAKNYDCVEVTSDGSMSNIDTASYVGTEKETQTIDGETNEIILKTGETHRNIFQRIGDFFRRVINWIKAFFAK